MVIELAGYLNETEKEALACDGAEAVIGNYRRLLLETLCRNVDPIKPKLGLPVQEMWFEFHPAKDRCYITLKLDCEEKKCKHNS